MIRWESFKQFIKFTYSLKKYEKVKIYDQIRCIRTIDYVHVLPGKG